MAILKRGRNASPKRILPGEHTADDDDAAVPFVPAPRLLSDPAARPEIVAAIAMAVRRLRAPRRGVDTTMDTARNWLVAARYEALR